MTTSSVRLARTSAVIGIGTLLSRVTGFLRVSALVALGLGPLTDAYNLANSTPNIVYELLVGGILTATLIPLFVEFHERDDPTATDAIATITLALLLVGTVAGTVMAPWIIDGYVAVAGVARGAGRAAQQELATDLLRWFMPQMLFYGITALATSLLNARRRFAAAAFAPVLNNVVVITVLIAIGRATSAPPTVQSVLDDPVLVLLLGLGTTAGGGRDGTRPRSRGAPGRGTAAVALGAGPRRRSPPRPPRGLDGRLRRREPDRVLRRAGARLPNGPGPHHLHRGVHVLPAPARTARRLGHDCTRARAGQPPPLR